MDYQTALNETKKSWSSYRECLLKHGQKDYRRVDAKERFEQKVLDLTPLYVDSVGKPFYIQGIAREISSKEQEAVRNVIVHYMNRSAQMKHEPHKGAGTYELLLESGAWDQFNGEPLERAKISGIDVLRSKRFKDVIFSYWAVGSDVSWIPRLSEPNEKTSEMSGIILTAGAGICNEGSRELGIVDKIRITREPHEIVYIEKHVVPLLAGIFNVPTEFFKYGIKKRKTTYSEPHRLELDINSQMVGSYCRSVLGILEIENGVPRKKKPCIKTKDDARSLLRALIDHKGHIFKYAISLTDDEFILNIAKECAEERGNKTSRITPVFEKMYKLEFEKTEGNKAVCKINERQAPVGKIVYEKLGRSRYEKIGTVIDHIKGGRWESERRPDKIGVEVPKNFEPRGELYQESTSTMHITGGKEVVKKVVEDIRPKNPKKLLQFLGKEMKIPNIRDRELQEWVYDTWDGDLGRLREKLRQHLPRFS